MPSGSIHKKNQGYRFPSWRRPDLSNDSLSNRTRVAGAFPNEISLLRLAGSILMDINEEWVTGTRYLSMEEE
jgi:putative transposase